LSHKSAELHNRWAHFNRGGSRLSIKREALMLSLGTTPPQPSPKTYHYTVVAVDIFEIGQRLQQFLPVN
jgi:hypothetical protein